MGAFIFVERILDPNEKKVEQPRGEETFCQEPSTQYLRELDDAGGDPRVVAGEHALKGLKEQGGWVPDWEARDAR